MSTQGQRIRKIRYDLKMSQTEFGQIFNIGKQFVSLLEKDKTQLNNEKLVKLLLDYNVNLNYLLGGIGEPFFDTPQQDEQLKKLVAQIVDQTMKERGLI